VPGLRSAAEPEVVLAFLRGEIDSERFGSAVRRALTEAGGLELLRSPDLDSERTTERESARSLRRGVGERIPDCSPAFPRR